MRLTRNIILGVYNDDDSQIVFVDTPGIHKPQHKLGKVLNDKAYLMTNNIDLILFMVDISKGFGKGDKFLLSDFTIDKDNKKIIFKGNQGSLNWVRIDALYPTKKHERKRKNYCYR